MDGCKANTSSKKQIVTKSMPLKPNETVTKEDQQNITKSIQDVPYDETKKDTNEKGEIENSTDKKSPNILNPETKEVRNWIIISQGQRGCDLGALEAAAAENLGTSGYVCCSKSDGNGIEKSLWEKYHLRESPEEGFGKTDRLNAEDADIIIGFRWRETQTGMGTCKVIRFKETNHQKDEYRFVEEDDKDPPENPKKNDISWRITKKTRCIIVWDLKEIESRKVIKKLEDKVTKFILETKARKIMVSGAKATSDLNGINAQEVVKKFLKGVFTRLKETLVESNKNNEVRETRTKSKSGTPTKSSVGDPTVDKKK